MFSNRGREGRSGIIGIIRDCVEIVAIVAAGVWAFYIFVYENRIVPSLAQPEVNFSASMQKVSRHDGLVGVLVQARAKNVGTVRAHFLGVATAVLGQRIAPATHPHPLTVQDNSIDVSVFANPSDFVPAYEAGYVTSLGDARTMKDLALDPGAEVVLADAIVYVPEHRFDRLRIYLVMRYTRSEDKIIPTQLHLAKSGLPEFSGPHDNIYQFAATVASLDLNGS